MSIISNIKNITSDKIFVIHGNEIPLMFIINNISELINCNYKTFFRFIDEHYYNTPGLFSKYECSQQTNKYRTLQTYIANVKTDDELLIGLMNFVNDYEKYVRKRIKNDSKIYKLINEFTKQFGRRVVKYISQNYNINENISDMLFYKHNLTNDYNEVHLLDS